jgi:hypothetical protein
VAPIASAADAATEVVVDAAVAVAAVDAGTKPKPGTGSGKPVTTPRDKGNPQAEDDLKQAEAAYKSGDYDLARRFCNNVTNSKLASPVQTNRALLLRGTIACLHGGQIGAAVADLRAMTINFYKDKLRSTCGITD